MIKDFKFATFEFEEKDKHFIGKVGKYIDANANAIFDFFELIPTEKKVKINIIPTKKEFDKKFIKDHAFADEKFKVPIWAKGYFSNNEIVYLSLNDLKSTSYNDKLYSSEMEYYKKTLLHEFVHYVNSLYRKKMNCGPTIKYLSEGIATLLSKQKENLVCDFDFSIDQILSVDMTKSCYDGWYLITKYLVENYDKKFVLQLFESNRQAKEFLQTELFDNTKKFYCLKIPKP